MNANIALFEGRIVIMLLYPLVLLKYNVQKEKCTYKCSMLNFYKLTLFIYLSYRSRNIINTPEALFEPFRNYFFLFPPPSCQD